MRRGPAYDAEGDPHAPDVTALSMPTALALSSATHAATITVPDDVATVQGALNAALAGDTVRVRQQATPYHEKSRSRAAATSSTGRSCSPRSLATGRCSTAPA
jgi:hypothetical protein